MPFSPEEFNRPQARDDVGHLPERAALGQDAGAGRGQHGGNSDGRPMVELGDVQLAYIYIYGRFSKMRVRNF